MKNGLAVQLATVLLFAAAHPALGEVASASARTPAQGTPIEVGRSVENRPIHCRVFGTGDDVLLIIATIHGNEAAGTPLVDAFAKWLLKHPAELEGRRVVIVPVANPDGMAADERFNARGVDLNRNFPAGNWGEEDSRPHGRAPLSEQEARVLLRVVCQYFPSRVISIHQPVACIDYDGPAVGLAEAMAAECDLPVKKIGSLPGSFGSFVGLTLEKPIITLELPKDAPMNADQLWQSYGNALIAALRFEANSEKP